MRVMQSKSQHSPLREIPVGLFSKFTHYDCHRLRLSAAELALALQHDPSFLKREREREHEHEHERSNSRKREIEHAKHRFIRDGDSYQFDADVAVSRIFRDSAYIQALPESLRISYKRKRDVCEFESADDDLREGVTWSASIIDKGCNADGNTENSNEDGTTLPNNASDLVSIARVAMDCLERETQNVVADGKQNMGNLRVVGARDRGVAVDSDARANADASDRGVRNNYDGDVLAYSRARARFESLLFEKTPIHDQFSSAYFFRSQRGASSASAVPKPILPSQSLANLSLLSKTHAKDKLPKEKAQEIDPFSILYIL